MWRVGVVRAPAETLLDPAILAACAVEWFPQAGSLRFLADPFGLWRDERLHVFVEAYDYRDRVGWIETLTFDAELRLIDRRPALKEPWHLSYPFVFEADGETWMLPEAHRSGKLTLYRAEEFPHRWTPAAEIALDAVAIDATPLFHDGRWWLFYTPAGTRAEKVSALHVAHAERLTGPWTPHPGNPVRFDAGSARPGGRPMLIDGAIVLPVQDCRRTYGGAVRALTITRLTPEVFVAEAGEPLPPPPAFAPWRAGWHTLSGAGEITLIDAKRVHLSPATLLLDIARRWGKLTG